MTWTATLTSKGQITLPKPLREAFNLSAGSRVTFEIAGQQATLRPAGSSVDAAFGILQRPSRKAMTIDEMNQAIRRRMRGSR